MNGISFSVLHKPWLNIGAIAESQPYQKTKRKEKQKRHLLRWRSAATSFNRRQFCHFILLKSLKFRVENIRIDVRETNSTQELKSRPCIVLLGCCSPLISQDNFSSASNYWYYSADRNKERRQLWLNKVEITCQWTESSPA